MLKQLIVYSFLIFNCLTLTNAKENESGIENIKAVYSSSKIDDLISKYDEETLYTAIFFINKDIHSAYIKSYPDFRYCPLSQEIIPFLKENVNLMKAVTNEDVQLIKKWGSLDKKITDITPMESDEEINFLDVIYFMKDGRSFYKEYITIAEQAYYSIGEDNICKLYYDILSYLVEKDDQEVNDFFVEYLDVYNRLKNNNSYH